MHRRTFLRLGALAFGAALGGSAIADEGVVVIGHPGLRSLDTEALRRIYAGRTVELDGQALRPVQLSAGAALRKRFATAVLQQSDEDFIAYWTVRRYIGKGAPPRELGSAAEVIAYVQATPGALGYIDAADLRPGLQVVLRR